MKVLFDHQAFSTQRYGGISRYFFNLNEGLNALPDVNSSIATLYSENEYLKNSPVPLNNALGRRLFNGHQNRIYRWNRRYSSLKIRESNFDVFHPTYYDTYFIDELKKPFVLTVHDMIHEKMEHQFTDNNHVVEQKKLLINKADAIIAISEHTKKDIVRFYPEADSKITVIHHGYKSNITQFAGNLAVPDNYILFVGERCFYKNFISFVKAIAPLLSDDKDLYLVCTAGSNFTADEQELFDELNIGGRCVQINATEVELNQLYKQANVFVFPSLIEGFGLPLLEAFAAGCPVAASNNTCFPEIGGNVVLYFDPYNSDSIYSTVKGILTDYPFAADLVNKAKERLKLFTMEKQIKETLGVYQQVC